MEVDNEGFEYPKVDEQKCINCSLCQKICPIRKQNKFHEYPQRAFLFQNKNVSARKQSTSGGFVSAIGEYVISNGGVAYGVAFDKDFIVKHQRAITLEQLYKFRKSKYVQSFQGQTFASVKEDLESGKLVLYTGTPCQVSGLNSYLGKKYSNLVLVDIMCHSVPSPLVFEEYKKYILNKMGAKKIVDIDFRDKSKCGYKYSMMTVVTDKGIYSEGIDTDPFLRAFFQDYSIRPSCCNCAFKTQKRVSDITIWDCFNINEIDKSFDDDKGTTRLLIQSKQGEEIIGKLRDVRLKEIDIGIAVFKVKEMLKSVNYNGKREQFFQNIDFEKYFPITVYTKLNGFVRKMLNEMGIYSIVKSAAKKILRK